MYQETSRVGLWVKLRQWRGGNAPRPKRGDEKSVVRTSCIALGLKVNWGLEHISLLWFWPRLLRIWRRSGQSCSLLSQKRVKNLVNNCPLPHLLLLEWAYAVSRIYSTENSWQIFTFDFRLIFSCLHCIFCQDILSYHNITNLPIDTFFHIFLKLVLYGTVYIITGGFLPHLAIPRFSYPILGYHVDYLRCLRSPQCVNVRLNAGTRGSWRSVRLRWPGCAKSATT